MKNYSLLAAAMALAAYTLSAADSPLASTPWIGDGLPDRNGADWYEEDPAPEFRATFALPEGVREAKVHFACAGFGWFSVDGKAMMCTDGLDTLWTPYDKTVYSKLLIMVKPGPGPHEIAVRLGNGFYNLPPLRFWGSKCFRTALAHGRPCFKMAMTIDGVERPLEWKWRKTNVVRNSVYLGTEVDATRAADAEWKPAAEVAGPKGTIRPWPGGVGRFGMGTFGVDRGKAKWLREGEVQVVDFGANASGVPEFLFRGEARGSRVEIVYGERLNADGSVNVLTQAAGQIKRGNGGPGAPRVACQRDVYICGGAACERFNPPFTWHIFRYAEIRGAKHLLGETDSLRDVRSMLSLDERAKASAAKAFKTENKDLAAIHEMCRRTFQANLIGGVQSDCPGRERLGYGGDIVSTYEAMMLNWDVRALYLKILQDFADEAADDGWITETAPYVGIADRGFGGRAGPVSWALAVPELIDGLLRHYNETKALDYYPVCARYVRLVAAKCPDGLVPNCIGDHEALERAPNGCTATAHWHRFVELTAKFAKMLGRTDDEKEFMALAEKIKAAFVAKYVKDGIVANGTQSAQAIGLYLGLVPAEQVAAAERQLVKAIEEKGYGPTTGIFSTRYMLMYLSEHGRVDVARKIVLHKGFPGWLHMLERGATTLWETWKESDNIYSNCHPMFGSVDEWILRFAR
ncbi:MAG: family 78 glycoside hydrolase catalytic domain [Kiritimatiellae bacterium]|nr:family 78 glycoside hydrolase catalytic domain [Kiritimatiellia bacterium]